MRCYPVVALLAVSAWLLSTPPSSAETCPPLPPMSAMTLTFNDEFNTPALDTTKWTAVAQGGAKAINNEQQAYVPGGVLMVPAVGVRLQANKTPFWTQNYTSGEIITRGHFAQTYGYFEMKAKLPNGNGLWPAFWLLPNNGSWPPEIDVFEYIYRPWGKSGASNQSYLSRGVFWPLGATAWRPPQDSVYSSNSIVYLTDNYRNMAASPQVHGDWGNAYHTYGVAWYPRMMAFYVDGVRNLCWVEGADTKGSVPAQPMFMLANLAIGAPGGWPGTVDRTTPFPANMDIAHVRAYQFTNAPATAPDPVAIMHPAVSSATARPGDTVTISADVVIGNDALPGTTRGNITIFNYDASKQFGTIDFSGPESYAANTTHHLSAPYKVPADLAPGLYTIYACVFWDDAGPKEHCLAPNQAPPITVVASTATNGACGPSNGAVFSKPPASNLCGTGTASAVTGAGPWSWTCAGTKGGASASCSAMSR